MGECTGGVDALRSLLDTEYAFGAGARTSVRSAFRYPAIADVSGSGDLGFTAGPWIHTLASGSQTNGHFLTIWKRDAACRWQIECDGGISHAVPTSAEPELSSDQASYEPRDAPLQKLIADDAVGRALRDFQNTVRDDGVAPGLRTYARTADFRLYLDGEVPMELAAANRYFDHRTLAGDWQEHARGRSADSSVAYAVGVLGGAHRPSSHAFVQVWQYAPRVANWGLRLLLINSLTPPMSK
jgi:hypothetical protein